LKIWLKRKVKRNQVVVAAVVNRKQQQRRNIRKSGVSYPSDSAGWKRDLSL